jgi:Fe-Mn family superoxide dismutase
MSCVKLPAVRQFDNLAHVNGLSPTLIHDHYKLYVGYLHKAHELCVVHAQAVRQKRTATENDLRNLKRDLTFTLAAARNHELYFRLLGSGEVDRPRSFVEAVKVDFGSFDNFLSDLLRTALSTHGWVFTVLDQHSGHVMNITSAQNGQFPMWNATPILAIDMADHAYYYDYGPHRGEYLDVVIKNLNWQIAAANLQAAVDAMAAAGLPLVDADHSAIDSVDYQSHPESSSGLAASL